MQNIIEYPLPNGKTLPLFRVTRADVARSAELRDAPVGSWCFIYRGELFGFYSSEWTAGLAMTEAYVADERSRANFVGEGV